MLSTAGSPSSSQVLDMEQRVAELYPWVNQRETPVPLSWSAKERHNYIHLVGSNFRLNYKGTFLCFNFPLRLNDFTELITWCRIPSFVLTCFDMDENEGSCRLSGCAGLFPVDFCSWHLSTIFFDVVFSLCSFALESCSEVGNTVYCGRKSFCVQYVWLNMHR